MFELNCRAFIEDILKKKYKNDINLCAKELNLPVKFFKQVLLKKSLPGIKTFKAIIMYCRKNDIDLNQYIDEKETINEFHK